MTGIEQGLLPGASQKARIQRILQQNQNAFRIFIGCELLVGALILLAMLSK